MRGVASVATQGILHALLRWERGRLARWLLSCGGSARGQRARMWRARQRRCRRHAPYRLQRCRRPALKAVQLLIKGVDGLHNAAWRLVATNGRVHGCDPRELQHGTRRSRRRMSWRVVSCKLNKLGYEWGSGGIQVRGSGANSPVAPPHFQAALQAFGAGAIRYSLDLNTS